MFASRALILLSAEATVSRLDRLPVRPLRPLLSPGSPVFPEPVCVYGWARAHSRLDMAVGYSTRDTQAIPPPTGSLSTQIEMAFYIVISYSCGR